MSLTLIIGAMWGSKTSELIKLYKLYNLKYKCLMINNLLDNRYGKNAVISHDLIKIKALSLKLLADIPINTYTECKVICIDESQFFSDLYSFVLKAVEKDDKIVIVSGLIADSFRNPLGDILKLIPYADEIKHLHGICHFCEIPTKAPFTLRLSKSQNPVLVGTEYVATCRYHYLNPMVQDPLENNIHKNNVL